jgi:hypothetical protein
MYNTPGPGAIAKTTLANMNAANFGEETMVAIMMSPKGLAAKMAADRSLAELFPCFAGRRSRFPDVVGWKVLTTAERFRRTWGSRDQHGRAANAGGKCRA